MYLFIKNSSNTFIMYLSCFIVVCFTLLLFCLFKCFLSIEPFSSYFAGTTVFYFSKESAVANPCCKEYNLFLNIDLEKKLSLTPPFKVLHGKL